MAEIVVCSEPPDEWVRYFEADSFDAVSGSYFAECQWTRHPKYTDMICTGCEAYRHVRPGRQFYRVTITYRREPLTDLTDDQVMIRLMGLRPFGPDVPADWREVN